MGISNVLGVIPATQMAPPLKERPFPETQLLWLILFLAPGVLPVLSFHV